MFERVALCCVWCVGFYFKVVASLAIPFLFPSSQLFEFSILLFESSEAEQKQPASKLSCQKDASIVPYYKNQEQDRIEQNKTACFL